MWMGFLYKKFNVVKISMSIFTSKPIIVVDDFLRRLKLQKKVKR